MRVAILYSNEFLLHQPWPGHPECPERLEVMMRELRKSGLIDGGPYELVEPGDASVEELTMVHEKRYVDFVKAVCERGGGLLDLGDTIASPSSYKAAIRAAGAAIRAVELVLSGLFDVAVALVRPPGHHAGRGYACGFCIFNNVALAAEKAVSAHGLKRVAIVDIDAHHGNGVQEAFYETDRVLYASIHQDPTWFPGTGFEDEVGSGDGRGFTINVPLPFLTGDDIYLKAFETILEPIVSQYRPQLVLVSLGLDVHYSDPVARLGLSMLGQAEAFARVIELAKSACGGRMVVVLEGGYSLSHVGKMLAADMALLTGREYELVDEMTRTPPRVRSKAEEALREVRRVQSEFWQL